MRVWWLGFVLQSVAWSPVSNVRNPRENFSIWLKVLLDKRLDFVERLFGAPNRGAHRKFDFCCKKEVVTWRVEDFWRNEFGAQNQCECESCDPGNQKCNRDDDKNRANVFTC